MSQADAPAPWGFDALLRSPLLAGLPREVLASLAKRAQPRELAGGDRLVSQGQRAAHVYFVAEGTLEVVVEVDGERVSVATLGPGDVVGESQLVAGGRHSADVLACAPCTAVQLSVGVLDELMQAQPTFAEQLRETIRQRLRDQWLRSGLRRAFGEDEQAIDLLAQRARWHELARGDVLIEAGAEADAWYLLIAGSLEVRAPVAAEAPAGQRFGRSLARLQRGDLFGELALLRGERRAAWVRAERPSVVAEFDAQSLDEAVLDRRGPSRRLLLTLAERLARTGAEPRPAAGVTFLQPRSEALAQRAEELATRLAASDALGRLAAVRTADLVEDGVLGDAEQLAPEHPAWLRFDAWLEGEQQAGRHILLVGSGRADRWASACVQRCDRVLLVADADGPPTPVSEAELALDGIDTGDWSPPRWLALLHPADRAMPEGTASWLDARTLDHHAHVRQGHAGDEARLGRWLTGRTVGFALSGGGGKGFAHLGVVKVLMEHGFHPDLIVGTSAGATAGGVLGRGLSPDELVHEAQAWVQRLGNPFSEFSLPVFALLRRRGLARGLKDAYEDTDLADSWIPLRMVCTDLTLGGAAVFDRGPTWKRVLASSSPPGILPAVVEGDRLLVDGGLVDNLPVQALVDAGCAVRIASNIGTPASLPAPAGGFPNPWTALLRLFLRRPIGAPTMPAVLLQSMVVGSVQASEQAARLAHLHVRPDLDGFSSADFSEPAELAAAGESGARDVVDQAVVERLRALLR